MQGKEVQESLRSDSWQEKNPCRYGDGMQNGEVQKGWKLDSWKKKMSKQIRRPDVG